MLLIYRYVGRFGPDLVHQLVPHRKKMFLFYGNYERNSNIYYKYQL